MDNKKVNNILLKRYFKWSQVGNCLLVKMLFLLVVVTSPQMAYSQERKIEILQFENLAGLGSVEIDAIQKSINNAVTSKADDNFTVYYVSLSDNFDYDLSHHLDKSKARGANLLISGEVNVKKEGYYIVLSIFDVARRTLESKITTKPALNLEILLGNITQTIHPVKTKSVGTVMFTSEIPGVNVELYPDSGTPLKLGETPIEKELYVGSYTFRAEAKNYLPYEKNIVVKDDIIKLYELTLKEDFKTNPITIIGRVMIGVGVGSSLVGLGYMRRMLEDDISAGIFSSRTKDEARVGMIVAYGIGFSLIASGIFALVKAPGDKEYFEKKQRDKQGLSMNPLGRRGMGVSYNGTF